MVMRIQARSLKNQTSIAFKQIDVQLKAARLDPTS